ncbi:MAG: ribonuclease H-like domain-containing protein [Candidatus Saccharimonadales bacterium]
MKLLVIDIENTPHQIYSWKLWGGNFYTAPNMVIAKSRMMCFAAKWAGAPESEVVFYSEFHHGTQEMLNQAWNLMNEADGLIHFNGDRFDEPKINRALTVAGYDPPSPYKHIDVYKTIRARMDFPYKRLDEVAKELGIEGKKHHSGFDLWVRCMDKDPDAWAEMREYNIQDIIVTENVFNVVKPWITTLPSVGAELGKDVCPVCGSDKFLTKEGFSYTKTGARQRFRCGADGAWLTSTRRVKATRLIQETR